MPETDRFRVLTLNMAHGRGLSTYQGFHSSKGIERNLNRIAHLLRKLKPDVVAFQEVDEDSHWNRRIDLLDYIKELAGYSHAYMGVHNRREGRLPLAYGNGLLTNFPIARADHEAFGNASLGEKGFVYAELETSAGILPVVNLHLDFRSRIRRIEQIEHIIQYLEDTHFTRSGMRHLSPIICGDFNSRRAKKADGVRHLFRYLQEQCAYQVYPQGKTRTFPSILPTVGFDFIFVPPSYDVLHSEVVQSYVSDHRPVIVELGIKKEALSDFPASAK